MYDVAFAEAAQPSATVLDVAFAAASPVGAAGGGRQAVDPARDDVPAGHVAQDVEPAVAENVPAGQAGHAVAPIFGLNVPGEHAVAALAPWVATK